MKATKCAITLVDLPDEVIQHVLLFAPAASIFNFSLTCKRLNLIANDPSLWRACCRADFTYWDESHSIKQKFAASLASTDWKLLYIQRQQIDYETTELLDTIIFRQQDRIEQFQLIVENGGYDVKDTLLRHLRVSDDAEDVLARRYWSAAVLGYLHRTMAVKEWLDIRNGHGKSLERGLAAFDVFILSDGEGDFNYVSDRLDDLAASVREEFAQIEEMSTRTKALAIASFLRKHNLTGIESDENYRDLQNNFIGVALREKPHQSLPLISCAIFCAIAERLGVDARPSGFPGHIYAIVYPPSGLTLEHAPAPSDEAPEVMYLDPFQSADEIPLSFLQETLRQYHFSPSAQSSVLGPASLEYLIIRMAHNLQQSVREHERIIRLRSRRYSPPVESNSGALDPDSAFYAGLWAFVIFNASDQDEGGIQGLVGGGGDINARRPLIVIMQLIHLNHPEDSTIFESLIAPLFEGLPLHDSLVDMMQVTRYEHDSRKTPHPRDESVRGRVKYRVGQLFRHKRYDYVGLITGWDAECKASENWVRQMDVDSLPGGRRQSFYHVLVDDRSTRYVAEENINLAHFPEPPRQLLQWAGQYFKRWDSQTGTFVSNIRDEYPDD